MANPEPSTIFRKNLAGLIEQLHTAEKLRDEKHLDLAAARLAKHSTREALEDVQEKIGWVKKYRPGRAPAPAETNRAPALSNMGGQHWDIRANQDGDFAQPYVPTMAELAALPSLKQLEEAEQDAISADYAADFRIVALEAMKAEAEKVINKTNKAIDRAIEGIALPEIPALMEKGRAAQAEYLRHWTVLRFLSDRFRNRFGADTGAVKAASDFVQRGFATDATDWAGFPGVLIWREAIERLRVDPSTPLPEAR